MAVVKGPPEGDYQRATGGYLGLQVPETALTTTRAVRVSAVTVDLRRPTGQSRVAFPVFLVVSATTSALGECVLQQQKTYIIRRGKEAGIK